MAVEEVARLLCVCVCVWRVTDQIPNLSVWKPSVWGKKSMASLFFDAQTRCLAYMEWVFEIFCAVKKDYGANCVPYSAELLGILSVHNCT